MCLPLRIASSGVHSHPDECFGADFPSHLQLYRRKRRFESGSRVTIDRAGNLYGTAAYGGQSGYGTVYKLSLRGGWVLSPLYEFQGLSGDGAYPLARVVFGPDGSLYGTTVNGGGNRQLFWQLRHGLQSKAAAPCFRVYFRTVERNRDLSLSWVRRGISNSRRPRVRFRWLYLWHN